MGNLFNYRKKIKNIKLQFKPKDEIGGMECIMNSFYLIADKITNGKNISTYKMFLVLSVVTGLIGMSVITVPFFITGKICWQIMTIIIGYPTTFCGLFGGTIYLYRKD